MPSLPRCGLNRTSKLFCVKFVICTYIHECLWGRKRWVQISTLHYTGTLLLLYFIKCYFQRIFFLPIRATPTTHKSFFVCLPSVEPCSPYLPWQHQTQAAVPSPNTQCTARPRGMLPLAHRVLLLPLCFFRSVSSM